MPARTGADVSSQPNRQMTERAHTVVFEPLLKKNLGVSKMKFKKEKLITGIFLSS